MWAVFLLAALAFAILATVFLFVANKIHIAMQKDRQKFQTETKGEKENEK